MANSEVGRRFAGALALTLGLLTDVQGGQAAQPDAKLLAAVRACDIAATHFMSAFAPHWQSYPLNGAAAPCDHNQKIEAAAVALFRLLGWTLAAAIGLLALKSGFEELYLIGSGKIALHPELA